MSKILDQLVVVNQKLEYLFQFVEWTEYDIWLLYLIVGNYVLEYQNIVWLISI